MNLVYQILNTINGHRYIGSSIRWPDRKKRHVADLDKGLHHSWKLQRAWVKYGSSCFAFQVVELCSKNVLTDREQYWIDKCDTYNRGYNCSALSDRVKISPEVMRMAARKCRDKLSEDAKKQWADPVIRARMIKSMKKACNTPEHRERLSKALKGRKMGKAWREKMGEAAKKRTSESRNTQREAMKRLWGDSERRRNLIKAQAKGKRRKRYGF